MTFAKIADRKVARALLLGLMIVAGPAAAETRCGWLENPTPGNLWLIDPAGYWIISAQGSPPADGADRVPAPGPDAFVATNGSYGHFCACVAGAFDPALMTVKRIDRGEVRPLAACRAEHNLKEP
jgi:hypothetical protein